MNDQTIRAIVEEIKPALTGRVMGKTFQLARAALAIDFRTNDGRYLYLSAGPNEPRLYLIARAVRELEKHSLPPSPFVLALRKHLSGARLQDVTKDEADRIVRLFFEARDEAGRARARSLVAQLTGRSANLFLLDENERIVDAMRPLSSAAGQEIGDTYRAPAPQAARNAPAEPPLERGGFPTLSEAADDHYRRVEAAHAFDARASTLAARLQREAAKLSKLRRNLESDLAAHGDAEEHKRAGDLLLANIATAERRGAVVRLTDYYAEDAPLVELEVDENSTLQEEAARRFARYTKARRAAQEVAQRLESLKKELAALDERRTELERVIAERDEEALRALGGERRGAGADGRAAGSERAKPRQKSVEKVPGVRRYRSSDGYEILVGRGAQDNDHLTFRVARSQDLWFHAADYPGSHVVVRRQHARRGDEVPHRTIIEAAQLAAHFSQARQDAKVAVNYAERKFLSKPKGARPGLVRMSSFRTILVEPRESAERLSQG